MRSRSRTPRRRPLQTIHDPLGKGLAAVRIHSWRDFHGCFPRENDEDVAYVYAFLGRTVIFWLQIRSKIQAL